MDLSPTGPEGSCRTLGPKGPPVLRDLRSCGPKGPKVPLDYGTKGPVGPIGPAEPVPKDLRQYSPGQYCRNGSIRKANPAAGPTRGRFATPNRDSSSIRSADAGARQYPLCGYCRRQYPLGLAAVFAQMRPKASLGPPEQQYPLPTVFFIDRSTSLFLY